MTLATGLRCVVATYVAGRMVKRQAGLAQVFRYERLPCRSTCGVGVLQLDAARSVAPHNTTESCGGCDVGLLQCSLAAGLRAELCGFVQTEITKSSPIPDSKREQAKTTDDMEIDGFSTPVGRHCRPPLRPLAGLLSSLGACSGASPASCRQCALMPSGYYRS